jgi:hypothetical protein
MTDTTIYMPKETLQKWLTALRSGEYKQATGALENGGGYCCLGVLQMCTDGKVERYYGTPEKPAEGLPTVDWLQSNSITFLDHLGGSATDCREPFLSSLNMLASIANDGDNDYGQYNFLEIADAIEACAVGE